MKKVLLALLSVAVAFTAIQPAQAEDQKVLAIIDSAINSKNFSQIIHEVCFTTAKSSIVTQNMSCPNGELFMEGPGAASAPWPLQKDKKTNLPIPGLFDVNNATFHGDSMVKSALTVDKNVKIVFIRFNDVTSLGNSLGKPESLIAAIDWVSKNASKYSIDAVSISQSGVSTNLKTKEKTFHPECNNQTTANAVSSLSINNIPTFAATGNDGLSTLVGFPACVPGVIGVGALGSATQLEKATNTGLGLDMVAPGRVSITKYNGSPTDTSGSSVATAVSAASYVSRNTFKTFGEYLNSLPKILIGTATYIRN